jgi:hypothetical protein
MLDQIGRIRNDPRDQHLSFRQFDCFPDTPFMVVPRIAGFERIVAGLHAEHDVDNVLLFHIVKPRANIDAVASAVADPFGRNAAQREVQHLDAGAGPFAALGEIDFGVECPMVHQLRIIDLQDEAGIENLWYSSCSTSASATRNFSSVAFQLARLVGETAGMKPSSHVIAARTAAWAPGSGGGVIPGGGCVNDPVGYLAADAPVTASSRRGTTRAEAEKISKPQEPGIPHSRRWFKQSLDLLNPEARLARALVELDSWHAAAP